MKNKRIMALALVSVLSVSALVPSALAATSDESSSGETAVQEAELPRISGTALSYCGTADTAVPQKPF